MPILICGAGIGGLTAAIALQKRGLEAHVLEAAAELHAVGAGIWVPTNAMRVLAHLDLAEQIAAAGYPVDFIELADARAGRLKIIDLRELAGRYGQRSIGIHRAELQRILVEALQPGTLHLDRRVVEVRAETDGAVVRFEEGGEKFGRLIVGADGLRSTLRQQLFPTSSLRYSGQSAYRAAVQVRLPDELAGRSREIWGPGCRFGFTALGADLVYWYATWDTPAGKRDRRGEAQERLERFAEIFPDPVPHLITATPEEALLRTDLFDLRPLHRWHHGRTVLLGDAAHASTPNLGQGGAQAIEDAYVLARCLTEHPDLERALQRYEALRLPKSRFVSGTSWRAGMAAHWQHPIARRVRNQVVRHLPDAIIRRQLEPLYRIPGLDSTGR